MNEVQPNKILGYEPEQYCARDEETEFWDLALACRLTVLDAGVIHLRIKKTDTGGVKQFSITAKDTHNALDKALDHIIMLLDEYNFKNVEIKDSQGLDLEERLYDKLGI